LAGGIRQAAENSVIEILQKLVGRVWDQCLSWLYLPSCHEGQSEAGFQVILKGKKSQNAMIPSTHATVLYDI